MSSYSPVYLLVLPLEPGLAMALGSLGLPLQGQRQGWKVGSDRVEDKLRALGTVQWGL